MLEYDSLLPVRPGLTTPKRRETPVMRSVPGPLGAIAATIQSWSARRIADADTAWLQAERRRVEAHGELAQAALRTEAIEGRLQLQRVVHVLPPAAARQLLEREIESERQWLVLDALQRARLDGTTSGDLGAVAGPFAPLFEPVVSDKQIRAAAFQGAVRIAQRPPAERPREQAAWEAEVAEKLPPLTADEVIQKARELLGDL
jgi:hypothetical protein